MAEFDDWINLPAERNTGWDARWNAWMSRLAKKLNDLFSIKSYTPVWTQGVNVTYNTGFDAHYVKLGPWVWGSVFLVASGAGTGGAQIVCSLPFTRGAANNVSIGVGSFVDVSTGILYPFVVYNGGGTQAAFIRSAAEIANPYLGLTGPPAIAAGDILSFTFSMRV